ncbi:MAG: Zn-ribbon domain-containing OB-fold protein [Acidimicrobiales bacterium]|nr:Zn-ribbon domain-containing OB-fold protein [Acidimicrobiales bacterium]
MDVVPDRPIPKTSALTEGFWQAAREHRLVVQQCAGCGALRHYPQPMCASCHSDAFTWTPVSGRGTVYTFTVTHQAFHPAWKERVPFAVATVELDEGFRMVTDLPTEDVERVQIGAPVECFFEDHQLDDGSTFTFPRFRLAADPS